MLLFHVVVLRVILDNYTYGLFKKPGRYSKCSGCRRLVRIRKPHRKLPLIASPIVRDRQLQGVVTQ
jgi:hypothetical protein